MGLDRAEVQAMSLREFILRRQAWLRNERTAVRRQLMVVNTIIGLVDGDPVTLEDFMEAGEPEEDEDVKEIQAMKGRYPSFVMDPEL
jgi:hypothetical protein